MKPPGKRDPCPTVMRHAMLPSLVSLNWRRAMKNIFSPGTDRVPFRDNDKRVGEPSLATAIRLR
jgi:hypothetical protein